MKEIYRKIGSIGGDLVEPFTPMKSNNVIELWAIGVTLLMLIVTLVFPNGWTAGLSLFGFLFYLVYSKNLWDLFIDLEDEEMYEEIEY